MPDLSPAAEDYLARLTRRWVPPLDVARRAYREAGVELPEVVAAIQERFGGYVIPVGLGIAVLGIYHGRRAKHLLNGFDYDDERDLDGEYIFACADAHPSYDFFVTDTGEFCGSGCGGGATSLAMKIEKFAVYSAVDGEAWDWCSVRHPEACPALDEYIVPEASDGISAMYRTPDIIVQRFADNDSDLVLARRAAQPLFAEWLQLPG